MSVEKPICPHTWREYLWEFSMLKHDYIHERGVHAKAGCGLQAGPLLVQLLSGRLCLTFALCSARVFYYLHSGSTRRPFSYRVSYLLLLLAYPWCSVVPWNQTGKASSTSGRTWPQSFGSTCRWSRLEGNRLEMRSSDGKRWRSKDASKIKGVI